MKILVLNAGSSSLKSWLYDLTDNELPIDPPEPLWAAQIDWSHRQGWAELQVQTTQGEILKETYPSESKLADTRKALQTLWSSNTSAIERSQEIDIVGHRVVHGGAVYQQSTSLAAHSSWSHGSQPGRRGCAGLYGRHR
jgi:acetate kinase